MTTTDTRLNADEVAHLHYLYQRIRERRNYAATAFNPDYYRALIEATGPIFPQHPEDEDLQEFVDFLDMNAYGETL